MKTIMTFIILLFSSCLYSQNNTFKLGFTGSYPNYYSIATYDVNWSWYNELNMNLWSGWWVGDTAVTVLDNLSSIGITGYFQPDTLRWAALGRSQINEAEETQDRFKYNNHRCGQDMQDNTQWGSGQMVRYYNKNSLCNEESPAGLILWNVNENGFQSIANYGYDPMYQIPFPNNGNGGNPYLNRYYVKPRMRISVEDTISQKPVVKIMVKAFNGTDIILERTITTNEFRLPDGSYDGRYLENYYLINLFVDADDINIGRGPDFTQNNLYNCHVDYQIYWFGEVSIWIDYVKVMDEAANTLFNNEPLVGVLLRTKLREKMERLNAYEQTYGEIVKGFYTEEFDYSCISCLKLLNDSLPVWSNNDPDYKMIGMLAVWSYNRVLKERHVPQDYDEYFDAVNPRIFLFPQYPHGSPFLIFYGMELLRLPYLPDNISFHMQPYYPQFVIDAFNQFFPNPVDPNLPRITVSKTEYNNHC